MFCNDCSGSRGGGVLLYVHKSLMCSPCVKFNAVKFEESLWYLISLSNKQTLLYGLVYRSPSSVETNNSKLLEALQIISQQYGHAQLLLMGDFNFPDINWVDTHCFSSPTSLSAKFLEVMQDSFLTQHVKEPTCHQLDQRPSVLDLIITLDPDSIMNLTHLPPLGSSDHECLLWQYFCNSNHKNFIHTKSYNYYKGDYDSLNNYLNEIDWYAKFNGHDINHNYNTFVQVILSSLDTYIPTVKRKNKKSSLVVQKVDKGGHSQIITFYQVERHQSSC